MLFLDRDLVEALVPDGDLEQTILVEVVGDALVVRRESSDALAPTVVQEAALPGPLTSLNLTEQRILRAVAEGPGTTVDIRERIGNRSRPTVSLALNRLKAAGWVTKTGRDWHPTQAARDALTAASAQQ